MIFLESLNQEGGQGDIRYLVPKGTERRAVMIPFPGISGGKLDHGGNCEWC